MFHILTIIFEKVHGITAHHIRQADTLEFAKAGTMDRELDKIFRDWEIEYGIKLKAAVCMGADGRLFCAIRATFMEICWNGYFLAFLAGYLLRGLFQSGYLWQLYYKESSMGAKWPFSMPTKWEDLFQGCFSLEYFRRCKLSASVGCLTNWRYFNSAVASTIFSKKFSTNFFFG